MQGAGPLAQRAGPPAQGAGPPAQGGGLPEQGAGPPAHVSGPPAQGAGPSVQGAGPPSAQEAGPAAQGAGPPTPGAIPPAQGAGPPVQGAGSPATSIPQLTGRGGDDPETETERQMPRAWLKAVNYYFKNYQLFVNCKLYCMRWDPDSPDQGMSTLVLLNGKAMVWVPYSPLKKKKSPKN